MPIQENHLGAIGRLDAKRHRLALINADDRIAKKRPMLEGGENIEQKRTKETKTSKLKNARGDLFFPLPTSFPLFSSVRRQCWIRKKWNTDSPDARNAQFIQRRQGVVLITHKESKLTALLSSD